MFVNSDFRGSNPIWEQVAARIRVAIASGELRAGDPLPSVRALSRDLRINPATVAKAYKELAGEGFVDARRGEGTFVRRISPVRRSMERKRRAHEQVRKMVEEGARLGIAKEDLAEAAREEFEENYRYRRH